jgi:hypothetical protein
MVKYHKDLVLTKIRKCSPADYGRILSALDSASPKIDERIKLAILKLSGGIAAKLQFYLGNAIGNWRNVIRQAAAACPEEMTIDTWTVDRPEVFEIRRPDRKQYIDRPSN